MARTPTPSTRPRRETSAVRSSTLGPLIATTPGEAAAVRRGSHRRRAGYWERRAAGSRSRTGRAGSRWAGLTMRFPTATPSP
jgi:hypothetical protein